jgi:quercetin dioxygenase-like cupin family protein
MDGARIQPFKIPDWTPWPFEGFVGVSGRVILDAPDLILALLRFEPHAAIPEHPGTNEAIVPCLEGEGFTSVGGVTAPFRAGERVTWPPNIPHRLWTEDSTMTTLMVERPGRR